MNLRKNLKRVIVLTLTMIMLASMPLNFVHAADEATNEQQDLQNDLDYLGRMLRFIKANYVYEVTEDELIEGALKGLFYNLDDYSNYYTAEEFAELSEKVTGDFGGIGVHITEQGGYITIITPIDGSPGFNAGLKAGDRVVSIDDTNIVGYTAKQASELMRGDPGTKVKLGIIRKGVQGVIYFDITREIIAINPVTYEILDNNIGFIKITEFNGHTLENVIKALNEFDSKKVDRIIFDVRNNPGGSLDEVINVLRFLVPEGPVVHIKNADGSLQTHNSYNKEAKYKLAVLVNEGSASASEIFAGAVQDKKAGTIIGTTTYGKGTVQTILPLTNGGGIKLTIAEYLTPNKNAVNKVGIKPDIVVENAYIESKVDLSKIPTLDKKRKPTLNTVGLDVLGAEQILQILGYNVNEPDGILDQVTFNAIKAFQADNGLSGYGVLDFTTQDVLKKAIIEYAKPRLVDKQLEKAIEILSK